LIDTNSRYPWAAVGALLAFLYCLPLAAQQKEAPAQHDIFTVKSKVDVVLVPVLVSDRQANAIGNLKKEDFQIFDEGKPQAITGFSIQRRSAIQGEAGPVHTTAPAGSNPQSSYVPDRFIVFMFDDMHVDIGDLARTQKAVIEMLPQSLSDSDMAAVVAVSGRINSGLTRDRAVLEKAIMQLQPAGLYRTAGQECPNLDYFHADLIENKHNAAALEAAIDETMSCSPGLQMRDVAQRLAESTATRVLEIGDQDVRVSLDTVREFVRRLVALPGQRLLILVSPGFLILTPEARAEESHLIDTAAQANVTVSAMDARGLYTSELDASETIKGSAETILRKAEYHRSSMSANENVMAELADGTGGTYFHNSNDLEGGFKRLTTAPEYLYLLEFSIKDVKKNGSYHRLKVTVDHDGLKLRARQGYFAEKPLKEKKR
jgi:VWFA-related protein